MGALDLMEWVESSPELGIIVLAFLAEIGALTARWVFAHLTGRDTDTT